MQRHETLFAATKTEVGATHLIQFKINTGDHPPIKQNPYKIPYAQRAVVEKHVRDMMDEGIITPSISPWSSPVVLVEKPHEPGAFRFCVDYRKINAVTVTDAQPLPRINEALLLFKEARHFSSLDLISGFHQVPMHPDDAQKTAFTTHMGLFEYKVMPFGVKNGPATFQRLMEITLGAKRWHTCIVYLDDIIIFTTTFEEHMKELEEIFELLEKAGLKLHPLKCRLFLDRLVYLGYEISPEGIRPDPEKVSAIASKGIPTTITELRTLIGGFSWLRPSIEGFATIAWPLTKLLKHPEGEPHKKKDPIPWDESCQFALEHLTYLVTHAPILAHPDFSKPFIIYTDASAVGLGAVLSQEFDKVLRPIRYASRTLKGAETRYPAVQQEALAVHWAIDVEFKDYIWYLPFVIRSDHKPLRWLLTTNLENSRLAQWAIRLQHQNFTIEHVSGKGNGLADCLSRLTVAEFKEKYKDMPVIGSITVGMEPGPLSELIQRQRDDPFLKPLRSYLEEGKIDTVDPHVKTWLCKLGPECFIEDGVIFRRPNSVNSYRYIENQIMVPDVMKQEVLDNCHSSVPSGHFGQNRTFDKVIQRFYWIHMRHDIANYIKACISCQLRKNPDKYNKIPLKPLAYPVGTPFSRISMDLMTNFPKTERENTHILVICDFTTRFPEAFPLKSKKPQEIADLIIAEIICRYGAISTILSDLGGEFCNKVIDRICEVFGTMQITTSGYHPETNGLCERFNQTLAKTLSHLVNVDHRDWDIKLPFSLMAYRSSVHCKIHETPFYLLHGSDMNLPYNIGLGLPEKRYLDVDDYKSEIMLSLAQAWELAAKNAEKSQERMKYYYDQKARESTIKEGDLVMIYTPEVRPHHSKKLSTTFNGPFRVYKVTPTNAHIRPLDHPRAKLRTVHLNRLAHFHGPFIPAPLSADRDRWNDDTQFRFEGDQVPQNTEVPPLPAPPKELRELIVSTSKPTLIKPHVVDPNLEEEAEEEEEEDDTPLSTFLPRAKIDKFIPRNRTEPVEPAVRRTPSPRAVKLVPMEPLPPPAPRSKVRHVTFADNLAHIN